MLSEIANPLFRIRRFRFALIAVTLLHGWATFATAQAISNFGTHRQISYSQPAAPVTGVGGLRKPNASGNKTQHATGLYNAHCAQCHGVDGRGIVTPAPRGPLTWRESLAFAAHLHKFSKQKASQSPPTCPSGIQTSAYFQPMRAPPVMLPPMQQRTWGTPVPASPLPFYPQPHIQQPQIQQPQIPAQWPTHAKPTFEVVGPIPEPQAELPQPQGELPQPQAELPQPQAEPPASPRRPRPIPEDLTPEEMGDELDRQLTRPPGERGRNETPAPAAGATLPTRFPILSSPLDSILNATENSKLPRTGHTDTQNDQRFVYPRTQTPDMNFTRWRQTATPQSPFSQE